MTGPAWDGAAALRALDLGTRVVVRYRLASVVTDAHFTDALGVLIAVGATDCTIDTRRGPVIVPLAAVVAAKPVPPPPPPRPRRSPG